jgi:hypothetical protein
MPWTGGAASVRSSEDGDVAKDFGRIHFTKDVAKLAAPPIAYVNTAGDDGTGVWSTVPATAAANKFATVKAALEAIRDSSATDGIADGCILYFDDGTHVLGSPVATIPVPQNSGAIIFTRSPESTNREAVILQFGAAVFDPQLGINLARDGSSLTSPLTEGVLTYNDVSLDRTGTSNMARSLAGTAAVPMLYQFVNCNYDNNAFTARFINATDVRAAFFGFNITGAATGNTWFGGGGNNFVIKRGVFCADMNGGGFDAFSLAGCSLSNTATPSVQDPVQGFLWSYTSILDAVNSILQENWASSTIVERIGFLNVLGEFTGTATTNPTIALANLSGSTRGMQYHHVTLTGAQNVGRFNYAYDNQNSTADNEQTHENCSIVGLVSAQINIKGDVFRSDPAGADGNFATIHGVDCEGIYSLYAANSVATEHPSYAGINNTLGTSDTLVIAPEDTIFTDYQGTTAPAGVVTAGAGGGDYTPASGSPLLNRATTRLVSSLDLAGAARSLPASSGAYA